MRCLELNWSLLWLQTFTKHNFLFVLLWNIRYHCAAEDTITEIPLDFQVPANETGYSTARDHDSIVVCYIELAGARLEGQGKFDAIDSTYNFDGNLCTHLVMTYLQVNNAFEITQDANFDEILKFRHLKEKYPHLKNLLQVSLVDQSRLDMISALISSAEIRHDFIMHMKATVRELFLDGLIMDTSLYTEAPNGFNILLSELKDEFKKEGLLVAVEIHLAYKEWFSKYPNIAESSRICDFVFLSTDNFNYYKQVPPLARYNAPLYSKVIYDENIYDNLKNLISRWHISRKNLVLTIFLRGLVLNLKSGTENYPFGYFSEWDSKEILSPWRGNKRWGYDEICSTVLNEKENWTMYWDDAVKVSFLKNGRRWITFENSRSITEKTKLVNSLGLGGIALMAVNYDDVLGGCSNVSYPLLKTVNHQLNSSISERESQVCSLYIDDNESNAVNYKPVMSLNPHTLNVVNNYSAEINCTVEGSPPFELSWKKVFGGTNIIANNDDNLDANTTVELEGDCGIKILISTLKINQVQSSDSYFCQVSYSNRSAIKSLALKSQQGDQSEEMNTEAAPSSSITIWTISILFPLMLIAIAVVGYVIGLRRNSGLTKQEIADFRKGTIKRKDGCEEGEEEQLAENPDDLPYDDSCELANNEYRIDKTKILGSGAFGVVYSGQVKDVNAAVKTTKPGADKQFLKSLLSELKVLSYIGHHLHVVSLLGAITVNLSKGILYIFVELCPLGNLQDCLRNSREGFGNNEGVHEDAVTLAHLYKWSLQISAGFCHLASKNLIHGDLAARNVLLYDMDTVKITDFGLSRKLYEYTTYAKKNQEPLPWRWMALESLRDLIFSVQSDVWSFGVTVWEIFSLGETPYPELTWSCDFVDKLKQNVLRLQKPEYASDSLYSLLLECWKINPNERPNPQKIFESFSIIMEAQHKHNEIYLQNEKKEEMTPNMRACNNYVSEKQIFESCV